MLYTLNVMDFYFITCRGVFDNSDDRGCLFLVGDFGLYCWFFDNSDWEVCKDNKFVSLFLL